MWRGVSRTWRWCGTGAWTRRCPSGSRRCSPSPPCCSSARPARCSTGQATYSIKQVQELGIKKNALHDAPQVRRHTLSNKSRKWNKLLLSIDCDCCSFAPKISSGKLAKNTVSRKYKITNKRHLVCTKELVRNASLWSQVSQSIKGCKRARHCGLIANRRSQADRDF